MKKRRRVRAKAIHSRIRPPRMYEPTPFGESIPKEEKILATIRRLPLIPTYILSQGTVIGDENREYIRRKLNTKLGPYKKSIERVSVRLLDVNGPRGGIDKLCRIKVVLTGLPSVVYEHQDEHLKIAIDLALRGIERAVRKELKKRITKNRPRNPERTI